MADIVRPGESAGIINEEHMPQNFDIVVYRGNDTDFTISLKNSLGVALNLTGATAKAQIKTAYNDPDPVDLTCTVLAGGQVRVQLSAATSASMLAGSYIWDFRVTYPSGSVRTYITGDVTISNRITV